MIEVSGKVTALDGDYAVVSINSSGCGRCHEEGGCGGHNLGQMLCSSPKMYRASNVRGAKVGDDVIVAIAEKSVTRSALIAYGMPLFGVFIGASVGGLVWGEPGSISGGVGGLLFAWGMLRFWKSGANGLGRNSQPFIK